MVLTCAAMAGKIDVRGFDSEAARRESDADLQRALRGRVAWRALQAANDGSAPTG